MVIFFFWVGLAVVIGVLASARGRDGFGWFLLACLLSPLLAGLFLLLAKDLKIEAAAERALADSKVCPRCAETVKAAALVCRYCGHEFGDSPQSLAESVTPAAALIEETADMGGGQTISPRGLKIAAIAFFGLCAGTVGLFVLKEVAPHIAGSIFLGLAFLVPVGIGVFIISGFR